ncbi:MAG: hypothetical protein ACI39U_06305, partial [Candidatus Cryptobacteroides sp.]
ENCKKAYVYFYDSAGTYTEVTLSDKIVADVDAGAGTTFYGSLITESGKVKFSYANPDTHIYVVWVDSNDQYHTYYEYTPTYPEKPDYTPESN